MKVLKPRRLPVIVSLVVMALVFLPAFGSEKEESRNRPARYIIMAAEYPGVEIPVDEDLSMDIKQVMFGRSTLGNGFMLLISYSESKCLFGYQVCGERK